MRGLNRCREIPITFIPDGIVPGKKRQKMWAVLADGRSVVRKENPQFPEIDNTRGISLVWQAGQEELRQERLKRANTSELLKMITSPY